MIDHRHKHQSNRYTPIAELMAMAQGNWLAILTAAGMPADSLAGRHGRPCPKCGGCDRFAPLKDAAERGAVLCRHCFHRGTYPRPGDGLATLQWWLRIDVAEAARWLSNWLGILPGHRSWTVASPVHRFANTTISISPSPELTAMADAMSKSMRPHWIAKAAAMLNVSCESLVKLQVGWSAEHRAMSFPMRDATGGVIGIRLRCPQTARKWAVPGSNAGLFFEDNLFCDGRSARTYVTEGPTDTAALLSLGLNVIGVPSAGGSAALLVKVVRRLSPTDVVVVADGDDAGKAGAIRLADTLSSLVPTRILTPPSGLKDARAWVIAGADRETLTQAANDTPVHRFAMRSLFDE